MKQFIKLVNANLSSANIYTNVYNFTSFKHPSLHPEYDSAVIDRLYFDIDPRVREGDVWRNIPAYEHMLRVHQWCRKHDYLHFPRFTGSGYDVIIAINPNIYIQNKKECVSNAQSWLCNNLDIEMDKQVKGDLARIHRIDNTFNHKETARRFCIPLSEGIINSGEDNIREVAKKQNFKSNWYGTKYWNIEEFDAPQLMFDDSPALIDIEMPEGYFTDLSKSIPECVRNLLAKKSLGWKERRTVILNLRDNCYLLTEAISILKKYLSMHKFTHCIRDERQPHYLYQHGKYLFPNKGELLSLGACPYNDNSYCVKARFGCLLYKRGDRL